MISRSRNLFAADPIFAGVHGNLNIKKIETTMKRLFYLLFLAGLAACGNEDEIIQEPTLQTVLVTKINSGSAETLTDISFGTKTTGYVCGSMGTLLKTIDGGTTWTKIQAGIQPSLNCIQAIDEKNVYTARNELYQTKDGGTNWTTAGLGNTGSGIFDICFVNATSGFITKNGVMKSTDSGKTWTLVFDAGADQEYYALNYNQIQFVNSSIGFCAGGKTYDGNSVGKIVKTTDGGNTWTSLKLKMSQVTAFHFLDTNTGFIFNFNQELWKTTDGGATWTKVSSSIPEKYPDCYFINASKVVLRTSKDLYHSMDGGVTWTKDYSLTDGSGLLTNMKFVDSRTGYLIGNNGFLAKITLN